MSIGEYCNRDVIVANRTATVLQIAQLMRHHHIGDVVITEESSHGRIPVGIVTDRDIVVEMIAKEVDLNSCVASDIMSYELVTVKETDGLWEVLQRMRTRGVRRVPVVDTNNTLVGVITADDLFELFNEQLSGLIGAISKEQRREKEKRR
jgi:CBS domain-containing protein